MENTQQTLTNKACKVVRVITKDKQGAPLMKTRQDGSKAPYHLVSVEFTEGSLAGKSTLAQRSLVNRDGVVKEPVVVGQQCFVTLVSVLTDPQTGVKRPFFEVSTTSNASTEDLLAEFGIATQTTATATPATTEEEVPLNP